MRNTFHQILERVIDEAINLTFTVSSWDWLNCCFVTAQGFEFCGKCAIYAVSR